MPRREQCHKYAAMEEWPMLLLSTGDRTAASVDVHTPTECWCKGVGYIKTDAHAANDRLAQWQCMKPSCPPSILADEGVGIGPCGWERGTGGRLQGRSRRERFLALIAIERYLASRGIAFKNPDQTHTPHHGIQSPGRAYQRGADATQPSPHWNPNSSSARPRKMSGRSIPTTHMESCTAGDRAARSAEIPASQGLHASSLNGVGDEKYCSDGGVLRRTH